MMEAKDWQNRAWIDWLMEGDRNIAFFGQAKRRRQAHSTIMRTLKPDGSATTSLMEMKTRVKAHF